MHRTANDWLMQARHWLAFHCEENGKTKTKHGNKYRCSVSFCCAYVFWTFMKKKERSDRSESCSSRPFLPHPPTQLWMNERAAVARWLNRKGPHLYSHPFSVISDPELRSPLTDPTRRVIQSITVDLFSLN